MLSWIVNQLSQPSTWRGLVWIATAAGLHLAPEQSEAVVAVGMSVAGAVGVFSKK
jgi:hypothetical protein